LWLLLLVLLIRCNLTHYDVCSASSVAAHWPADQLCSGNIVAYLDTDNRTAAGGTASGSDRPKVVDWRDQGVIGPATDQQRWGS
jgi:hypothetical protein